MKTGHVEFNGSSYLTREIPDLECEGQLLTVAEDTLELELINGSDLAYKSPEARGKDFDIFGYASAHDLRTKSDKELFEQLS